LASVEETMLKKLLDGRLVFDPAMEIEMARLVGVERKPMLFICKVGDREEERDAMPVEHGERERGREGEKEQGR
jgi:hypothetical protein